VAGLRARRSRDGRHPRQGQLTQPRNTSGSSPDAATNARSAPSSTHCSARSGTCCRPARPTAISAPTTSPNATPNARPSASSNSSNADTTSRSQREPRQPERTFPVRQKQRRGGRVGGRSCQAKRSARARCGPAGWFVSWIGGRARRASAACDGAPSATGPRVGRASLGPGAWSRADVAKEVATLERGCPTLRYDNAKGPAVQGLSMRRRGLEPPPG
jgi:hypothetical protein